MLSPLSLAPYPTPHGPSSSPRLRRRGRRRGRPLFQSPPGRRRRSPAGRQRRKQRVPVLLQARARSRRCSKPGPAAAGAGMARGPAIAAPGGGELMHTSLELECRDEPDQPKTGSDNQEDIYPDSNGYKWIKCRINLDKI